IRRAQRDLASSRFASVIDEDGCNREARTDARRRLHRHTGFHDPARNDAWKNEELPTHEWKRRRDFEHSGHRSSLANVKDEPRPWLARRVPPDDLDSGVSFRRFVR